MTNGGKPKNSKKNDPIVGFMDTKPMCATKDLSLEAKKERKTIKEKEMKENSTHHFLSHAKYATKELKKQ
jgi:hypothetical protein